MDDLTLKCHMVSVVKTFDEIGMGDSLNDTLIVGTTSTGGKLQFCNPYFEEIVAAPMVEMIGTSYKNRCLPDFFKRCNNEFSNTLDCGLSVFVAPVLGTNGKIHMVRWKYELISPGSAFLLGSGTVIDYDCGEIGKRNVIYFPMKPDAR
jgi:hypothetical protein